MHDLIPCLYLIYFCFLIFHFVTRLGQYQSCHNMNKNAKNSHLNQIQFHDFKKFFKISPKRSNLSPNKTNLTTAKFDPFSPTNKNLKKFMPSLKLIRYASDPQFKYEQTTLNLKGSEATKDEDKRSFQQNRKNVCHSSFIADQQFKTKKNQANGQFSMKHLPRLPHMSYFTEIRQKTKESKNKTSQLKQTSSTSSADIEHKQLLRVPSFLKIKANMKGSFLSKENFIKIKKLGTGKFCSVYLIKDKKTGFLMAMKQFKKQRIIKQQSLQQFIREVKIQSYLNHPNIIKIYGFFHDEENLNVLLELGCHGQLFNFLNQTNKCLTQQATFYVAKQILDACNFMHSEQILHRDIKPENLVLIHGIVKLCDFGWAVKIEQQLRITYCGTPLYFSPELLKGQLYDQKVDVWAIGILLYQLCTRQSPFQIFQQRDIFKIVTHQFKKLPPQNKDLQSFISSMLQKKPQKRLSCAQLLKNPTLQQYAMLQTCQELLY